MLWNNDRNNEIIHYFIIWYSDKIRNVDFQAGFCFDYRKTDCTLEAQAWFTRVRCSCVVLSCVVVVLVVVVVVVVVVVFVVCVVCLFLRLSCLKPNHAEERSSIAWTKLRCPQLIDRSTWEAIRTESCCCYFYCHHDAPSSLLRG